MAEEIETQTSGRREVAVWAGMLTVCVLLNYVFFTGLFCSDDGRYFVGVQRLVEGLPIRIDGAAERRLMLLLPGAFMYALTHAINPTIAAYSLFSIGMVLLTALLARRMAGLWAASLAAALVATAPVVLRSLGTLSPDFLSALFFVGVLLTTRQWLEELDDPHHTRLAERWALATGVLAAGSVMAKESGTVLVAVPLAALALPWLRSGLRGRELSHVFVAGLGASTVLAAEALLFRWVAGVWHSSLRNAASPHDFRGFMDRQGHTVAARFKYLLADLQPASSAILVGGILAGGLLLLVPALRPARRSTRAMTAVLWGAVVLGTLYFTVGTTRLSEWVPPVIQARYYLPLLAPASVLLAVAAAKFVDAMSWKWLPAAISVVVAITIVRGVVNAYPLRGTAYASFARETFVAARRYAEAKFPQLPLEDTPSGWTTDLQLCRQLIVHPDAREKGPVDERVRHHPERVERQPPFVLVGQGNFLVENAGDPYFIDLQRHVQDDGWKVTLERAFVAPARLDERGLPAPRELALDARDIGVAEAAPDDVNATRLYLVTKIEP